MESMFRFGLLSPSNYCFCSVMFIYWWPVNSFNANEYEWKIHSFSGFIQISARESSHSNWDNEILFSLIQCQMVPMLFWRCHYIGIQCNTPQLDYEDYIVYTEPRALVTLVIVSWYLISKSNHSREVLQFTLMAFLSFHWHNSATVCELELIFRCYVSLAIYDISASEFCGLKQYFFFCEYWLLYSHSQVILKIIWISCISFT